MLYSKQSRAFSLVEVVLALGVVTVTGVAMIGLLSVGIQGNRDSKEQLQAATIAESIYSTLRAAPTANYNSGFAQPGFPLPYITNSVANTSTPIYLTWDGTQTTSLSDARFGLFYQVTAPANYIPSVTPSTATVYLCFFWPAQAANPTTANLSHFDVTSTFALP